MVRLLERDEVKPVTRDVITRAKPSFPIEREVDPEFASDSFSKRATVFASFDNDGIPRGILVGFITPDLLTGVLTGYEYLWVVEPRHSGALQLLDAFEKYCKEQSCQRLVIGAHAMLKPERKMQMYSHLGFAPHTFAFSKAL